MEDLCRICLGIASKINRVNILFKCYLEKTVSDLIIECATIKINQNDFLPKYVCVNCYRQLLELNQFRELIIKSDFHLNKKSLPDSTNVVSSDDKSLELEIENCDDAASEEFLEKVEVFIKEETISDIVNSSDKETDLGDNVINKNSLTETKQIVSRPGRKPSNNCKEKRKIHEFKCNLCQKILYGRSNRLKEHILMAHSDIKNHSCEICQKKFKSKQQLVNHRRIHTGEKPYQCEYCSERFTSPQNLFNHKKKHTGDYKSYKCNDCDKGYPTPGELETHIRIAHTGERPFLCEICSRAYSSIRNLGFHIRSVHEKNEKCQKCGLMFSIKRMKQHLQKHRDREEGIRRFTCDKCGKGFFSSHALKKHEVVHTGEKPYLCQICQKPFSQKSSVETHMRVHSDIRSFSCQFCTKTFKYKQHFQLHLKKKHEGIDVKTEINSL